MLPLTLVVNAILYRFQRHRVFNLLGLRIRRNTLGLVGLVLTYQMLMSPIAVAGYMQELLACAAAGNEPSDQPGTPGPRPDPPGLRRHRRHPRSVPIVVTPTWAKPIDFETALPSAVAELVRQRDERQRA